MDGLLCKSQVVDSLCNSGIHRNGCRPVNEIWSWMWFLWWDVNTISHFERTALFDFSFPNAE